MASGLYAEQTALVTNTGTETVTGFTGGTPDSARFSLTQSCDSVGHHHRIGLARLGKSARYNLPGHLAGEAVIVRACLDGKIEIHHQERIIAEHTLVAEPGTNVSVADRWVNSAD